MLEKITEKFSDIFRNIAGKSKITEKNIEEAVEQIKVALLDADVNLRVVRRFINSTIEEALGEKVLKAVNPGQQFIKIVYDKMTDFLGDEKKDLALKGKDVQSVVLFLGLQGSGKTTTAAKLANKLKKEGRNPLLVACDIVRPAAIEQLEMWANRVKVKLIKQEQGADPAAVVFDTINYATKENVDVAIIDTAGRLHNKTDLMNELSKIKKIVYSKKDVANIETLLVIDSTTGQNGLEQAKIFNEVTELSGIILTKYDGTAKGGIIFPIIEEIKKPIKFLGVGEGIDDLKPFNANEFVKEIFDK